MRRTMLCAAAMLAACTAEKRAPSDDWGTDSTASADSGSAAPDTVGSTITGVVKFAGTPPPSPPIDMSADPGCQAIYGEGVPTDFQVVVTNGMLADVLVYVKTGLPDDFSRPLPGSHPYIDQSECRLRPHVLGMRAGQQLDVRNSDPVRHTLKATPKRNPGFSFDQAPSEVAQHTFPNPEMMVPIACERHPWMRGNIAVFSHPFFAATGHDGTFTLTGLPPGVYELEAWHAHLGARTVRVKVPPRGKVATEITFAARA